MKLNLNKVNENPFYGMKNCLKLFQEAEKTKLTHSFLNECWKEVLNTNGRPNSEKKQLFFVLLFSIGDITARQHNIFHKNKVDSGGNAMRENFRIILSWMKLYHKLQYNKFMFSHLFNEFTTFDNLFAARIKTQKKTRKIIEKIDMIGEDIENLATYISMIIRGNNPFDKLLVAKFLTRPRLSKRQGHKSMLPETKVLMKKKQDLILKVSVLCDFPFEKRHGYTHFSGYYNWRKQYNGEMQSVLFSSGKITEFDQEEFVKWLDNLPSSARMRVRNMVLDKTTPKPKWGEIGNWFLTWEGFKTEKQTEQRVLEEKVRQGDASEETAVKLEQVKKEAKVTVGANNFKELFNEIITGTVDELKLQPFLDKINMPFNNLVFADDSGSMKGASTGKFTAFQFASFIAMICLMKNPSDIGRSMMGLFSRVTRIIRHINIVKYPQNSLINSPSIPANMPLYNPELSFLKNLHNLRGMMDANTTYDSTYITSIPDYLNSWCAGDDSKIELLREFPVWTLITDGNFNNLPSPESSMNDFMYKCQTYFGFKPFVVGIDVGTSSNIERFSGIENFMFIPPNPAQIEQFLVNFQDIDIMDVYTPLNSLFRSNRYTLVKENVL
jgi:hypothetical protein